MSRYVVRAGLQVAGELADFVETQLLPGLTIGADAFWAGFAGMLAELAPENRRLLAVRDQMQGQIDTWLTARRGQDWDNAAWQEFLRDINPKLDYFLPGESVPFKTATSVIDAQ